MAVRWNEKSLSELSGSFWQACALRAAVKLDFFTLLEDGGKSALEMATALPGDQRGVSALLNALAAMGLLIKRNGFYINSEASSLYLNRNSERYLGWRLLHHYYLLPSWARLDEAVRKGVPQRADQNSEPEDSRREAFLMAMDNNARSASEEIVPHIHLERYDTLLDLGGGPGTYAVQFCRKHPNLKAIVFDLPSSRSYAEQTIRKYGLENRIQFHGGNFFDDPIPGEYDVVWMSHILHSSGPDECRLLIAKAARVLKPGGMLLVHDFILNDSGDSPLVPALFALNMLVMTDKGRSYSESEIKDMLTEAGLLKIRRMDLRISNNSGVIVAEKGDG